MESRSCAYRVKPMLCLHSFLMVSAIGKTNALGIMSFQVFERSCFQAKHALRNESVLSTHYSRNLPNFLLY